jgi:hypothetical protein
MKPYISEDLVTIRSAVFLLAGSILFGILVGVLAYFISNFLYLFFVFPAAIGILAVKFYKKLVLKSKMNHRALILVFSIVAGISVAWAFYATPYVLLRREISEVYQTRYELDAPTASRLFDAILVEETGSRGFIGYMKFQAREGSEFDQYVMFNAIPIELFSFRIASVGAWLYWIVESVLFTLPLAFTGYKFREREYCKGANDWYEAYKTEIGMISLDKKDGLLSCIQTNGLNEIRNWILPEGEIEHPAIEVYRQYALNKKGDVLLSVIETFRESATVVKRKTMGQWEVPLGEFESFAESWDKNFHEDDIEGEDE